MRKMLTIAVAGLLLAAAGAAMASDHAGKNAAKDAKAKASEFEKRGDKWLLANGDISIWFHETPSGKAKPMLKVFATNADGNVSGYKFKITRLCEVAENATSCANATASVNLAQADDWSVDKQRDESNGTLTIRMSRTAEEGTIALVFHLRDDATEAKFDVEVANWKWTEAGAAGGVAGLAKNRLLLEMSVTEKPGAAQEGDTLPVAGGYVSWADNATAHYAGGLTETLNVTAFVQADDAEANQRKISLRFDGSAGYSLLAYDPTLGVASTSTGPEPDLGVPAAGMLAAAAAVAAAAVVLRARRSR